MQKRRIAVAMSGGVDSSAAALRLVEQGEDVFGVMLRLWSAGPELQNRCCSPRDLANARSIAADLDIPFYVLDAKDKFKSEVVNTFIDGYANGITPNPCIACNRNIRWGWLFERVLALGATHMATGHYARVRKHGDHFQLLRGLDRSKDQSYVLHMLSQQQLSRALFPLGDMLKPEVRSYAEQHGLIVANRVDSQDLCFLGHWDYREFLEQEQLPLLEPGPIVDTAGEEIGQHSGLAAYTIGQRKGIGVSAPEPYYVLSKDVAKNAIIVGHYRELGRKVFSISEIHWIGQAAPPQIKPLQVQVRYKATPVEATIEQTSNSEFRVHLSEALVDVTPGQWAVFYSDEVCLGGGIILP